MIEITGDTSDDQKQVLKKRRRKIQNKLHLGPKGKKASADAGAIS